MYVLAPLDQIDDNPFQTRQVYDPAAIRELADSIRQMRPSLCDTRGLVHVPPARAVDAATGRHQIVNRGTIDRVRFQLGAGHSRLRAFRLLAQEDPEQWTAMPLDVTELDDRALADIIFAENARRRDLSAVEEAAALRMAIQTFGYTQAQIGERWGLSQGAVANKLRLLELPEEAQAAIRNRQITERHGRALLSAQAKAPALYDRLAAEVLPLPEPAAEVVERARELLAKCGWWLNESRPPEGTACTACGAPVRDEWDRYGGVWGRSDWPSAGQYLCQACHRAATGWQPPTAAAAEESAERIAYRIGKRLREAPWPLDWAVGGGDGRVRSALCLAGCPRRMELPRENSEHDRNLCLDAECWAAKQAHWQDHLQAQLTGALQDGHPVRIDWGTNGNADLYARTAGDLALVETRQCRGCEHSRLRYAPRQFSSDIRVVPDLPFVWSCDNAQRKAACSRRAEAALRTADQKAAEAADKAAASEREQQGQRLLKLAAQRAADALAADSLETWRAMAAWFLAADHQKVAKLDTTAAVRLELAKRLVTGQVSTPSWTSPNTLEVLVDSLSRAGAKLGVSLVAPAASLDRRLTRLERWIETELQAAADGDRTPATDPAATERRRIEENLHNLEEWLREATLAAGREEMTRGEYDEIAGRIAELSARLEEARPTLMELLGREAAGISQEMPAEEPLPRCIWDDGDGEDVDEEMELEEAA